MATAVLPKDQINYNFDKSLGGVTRNYEDMIQIIIPDKTKSLLQIKEIEERKAELKSLEKERESEEKRKALEQKRILEEKKIKGKNEIDTKLNYNQTNAAVQETIKSIDEKSTNTFTDPRDGKIYKTVKIGNQVWMAENLNYDAGNDSWFYDNNPENGKKYGRLYQWETAKKVAPKGWHLPSKNEFMTLLNNLGGEGTNAYKQIIPVGSSGFNALFGGYRANDGNFYNIGNYATFWSSSEDSEDLAWECNVDSSYKRAYLGYNFENYGYSVRCVKD